MKNVRWTTGLLLMVGMLWLAGCSTAVESTKASQDGVVETQGDEAKPPKAWIQDRVERTKERLSKTPEGRLVWESMEAHGGLATWFEGGPVGFRFRYAPVGEKKVRDTYQVVDTWNARARHHVWNDASKEFGWTGEEAWIKGGESGLNARFWSLTPYYFVAMPFVLGDDGVVLKGEGSTEWEGKTYDLVRVTYESGTGDAPDDFYVVYIDRETKRLGGLRYVVSYPGYFPNGGHSPEKFMSYDGALKVGGTTLSKTYRTFAWDPSAKAVGELKTNSSLSEVAFKPEVLKEYFDVPGGAVVKEGF